MPGSDAIASSSVGIALAADEEPNVVLECARGGVVGRDDDDQLGSRSASCAASQAAQPGVAPYAMTAPRSSAR